VGRRVDRKADVGEVFGEDRDDVGFVVDDQDSAMKPGRSVALIHEGCLKGNLRRISWKCQDFPEHR